MANCFEKGKQDRTFLKSFLLPVLLGIALLAALYFGIEKIGQVSEKDQLESAQRAVERTAVQCYAIEGQYPPNYEYMKKKYGLIIDTTKYAVHYENLGSNTPPFIQVKAWGDNEGMADDNGIS